MDSIIRYRTQRRKTEKIDNGEKIHLLDVSTIAIFLDNDELLLQTIDRYNIPYTEKQVTDNLYQIQAIITISDSEIVFFGVLTEKPSF